MNSPDRSVLLLTILTAQVIGIDVYPYPVPEDIPPNLDFQVDDLNSPYERLIARASRRVLLTWCQVNLSLKLF